ncbi:MAG: sulfatase-like hydrolase/transferase [Clostridia bacterium]|nr:sulfatase-like hydrolase/transferase [Clostridia bacterium]
MKRDRKHQNTETRRRRGIGKWIAASLAALVIVGILAVEYVNYILRDYRPEGRKQYLETIEQVNNPRNVVIIYVDDMGYGDLSCTGATAISTPNIDALAENGVLLTNYYAPAPICSASRAGLLTGRYPIRTLTTGAYMNTEGMSGHWSNAIEYVKGTYQYLNTGLPTDEILLPEVLQQAGYETALVGKWHLGIREKESPNNRGFDLFYGALYSDDNDPYRIYHNDKVVHYEPYDQTLMTAELTEVAVQFIEDNKDQPFFLYYASPFPHWPAQAGEAWVGTSQAGVYGDCMQEVDWSVGEIMKSLEENGLTENTLVLFTSDNGPWFEGSTGGQRGRKDTNYGGGSHVPFIAYMPGTIPAGEVYDGLMDGIDVFPTILSFLKINEPTDRVIDGIDMLSYLKGETASPRTSLFINKDKSTYAVIDGSFKYLERSYSENGTYWMLQQGPFLYNLETDPEESYDVTTHYPEKAEELAQKIKAFKESLKDNIRGWK